MLNKATLKYNKEPKKCINMYDAIFQRTNLKLLSDITGSNDISIFFLRGQIIVVYNIQVTTVIELAIFLRCHLGGTP